MARDHCTRSNVPPEPSASWTLTLPTTDTPIAGSESQLAPQADAREAWELLELLDDAMFAAIAGDALAVDDATRLWVRAVSVLNGTMIDESREHYLRFATDAVKASESVAPADSGKVKLALAVIELLKNS